MEIISFNLGGRTVRMTGNPNDAYFNSVDKIAAAEAPLAHWADSNLPADAVMFDVGGNIGVTALLLTGLRPQGHLTVFEALPANVNFLRQNLALNNIANCTIVEAAVGDQAGRVNLTGEGATAQVGTLTASAEEGVPVIKLDDYARSVGLTRLDFMKMDIEGYEPAALAGAAELIARHQTPILMEFNTWCLAHAHDFNPIKFCHALWVAFEVDQIKPDGTAVPAGNGDANRFLHDTMVLHGAVDDILLRPRLGVPVPNLKAAIACDPADEARIVSLERELDAIKESTSWRLTQPIRTLKSLFTLGRDIANRTASSRQ